MFSRSRHAKRLAGALCALVVVASGLAPAASAAPWRAFSEGNLPNDRVIVKWRDSGVAAVQIPTTEARAARLSQATGIALQPLRQIRGRLDVMRLANPMAGAALRQVLARLNADPSVQYAEIDGRRYALAAPNDPRFLAGGDANGQWQGQWYLNDSSSTTPAAIGATTAWDSAKGVGQVIAVIDTGIDLTHPDLGLYGDGRGGKLLPGFDFVCNDSGKNCASGTTGNTYLQANDGNGWDGDSTDPGDWLSTAEVAKGGPFASCGDGPNNDQAIDSTWHGTRVAGIAAAITDNALGVAGVAPEALILPVRVIGKCSGFVSDIVAGMYWAAGMTEADITSAGTSVPSNLHPAQVLNLSIGGRAPCSQTEQAAVSAIGVAHVIVIAAGNDGGPVSAPANCMGAVAVAGLRHIGTKVGYSNVSSTAAAVTIAAPAGNCVNLNSTHPFTLPCLYSIETTSNDGLTTPGKPFYTYALMRPGSKGNLLNEGSAGTSFAAPIVSGVIALMIDANPKLSVAELVARLKDSATPFPTPATPASGGTCHVATLAQDANKNYSDVQDKDCQCTTATCGAGMVNAAAALGRAQFPLPSITTSASKATIGQSVTLDGSASTAANGYRITAYHWSSDPTVEIANATSAVAKLVFPALRPLTLTLLVTDNAGRQAFTTATIDSQILKAGGGRGALGTSALLGLAFGAGITFLRRRGIRAAMLGGWH